MSALGQNIAAKVVDALTRVGVVATLTKAPPASQYNPATGQIEPPNGFTASSESVRSSPTYELTSRTRDNPAFRDATAAAILAARGLVLVPEVGDVIEISGVSWRIVAAVRHAGPGGVDAAWELGLAKP